MSELEFISDIGDRRRCRLTVWRGQDVETARVQLRKVDQAITTGQLPMMQRADDSAPGYVSFYWWQPQAEEVRNWLTGAGLPWKELLPVGTPLQKAA